MSENESSLCGLVRMRVVSKNESRLFVLVRIRVDCKSISTCQCENGSSLIENESSLCV